MGRELAHCMKKGGLRLNSLRPDLLRFMPALNVSMEEIAQMIGMLAEVLERGGKGGVSLNARSMAWHFLKTKFQKMLFQN